MANANKIVTLQNSEKTENVYPITVAAAIYTNANRTVESVLNDTPIVELQPVNLSTSTKKTITLQNSEKTENFCPTTMAAAVYTNKGETVEAILENVPKIKSSSVDIAPDTTLTAGQLYLYYQE